MKKFVILCALIPTVMVACKDSKKNPIAAASEASKDKDLQKSFQSECSAKPLDAIATAVMTLGQASVKSARVEYKFTGNLLNRKTVVYANADCAGESWVFEETGKFKIADANQKSNDGGRHIDMDFDKLTLVVKDENGAKAANGIKLCNKADWSANSKEQNVSASSKDATCYGIAVPRKYPNIYRVDAGVLYLGATAQTPTERPAKLDNVNKFTAVK